MHILPAIDLLDNRVVRLRQGRYEDPTIYSEDPPGIARKFRTHTDRLHVVDLAGAKAGTPIQTDMIRTIARECSGGMFQVGGGVRNRDALEAYLALGAQRVVLGTAAVKDPELVRSIATAHPGVVVIAVDAKDGFVAVEGWTEVSKLAAIDVVLALKGAPIAAVLYTDVSRDGMGSSGGGPNIEATAALAARSPFPVIASGGVGTEEHLRALSAIANIESAIVGRALYDGSLTIEKALAAAVVKN
jgi:phosphoribosylformimino-5-aminoimidazole carboxamide ribotide isomerase